MYKPLIQLLPAVLLALGSTGHASPLGQGPSPLLRAVTERASSYGNEQYSLDTSTCSGYNLSSVKETSNGGLQARLNLVDACSAFGVDYEELIVDVEYQTKERLHVHIYDAQEVEFQVPESVVPRPSSSSKDVSSSSNLVFNHQTNPFAFWITRRSDPSLDPIFDTRPNSFAPVENPITPAYGGVEKPNATTAVESVGQGGLIFEAGYLEIASSVPIGANIYGLGEVIAKSGLRRDENATVQTMWARDVGDPEDQNMYGSHPIHIETRYTNGASFSHGVFLLSSEGMDVILRPGVIDYRVLGGSLDFYFLAGPSPIAVIEQYSDVVGKPNMIPAWSLGMHQCRWGYNNVSDLRDVVEGYKRFNIPLEVVWNDIDYMDTYRNWVPSPTQFPPEEYGAFVDELNANHQHYIAIIDAAVSIETNSSDNYAPYASGTNADAFIKNEDGSQYIGKVWPGYTVFPDWFQAGTQNWWTEAFQNYSNIVKYSGIWLDMNEASSFCDGSCGTGLTPQQLQNITPNFILPGDPGNVVLTDNVFPEGYNQTLWGYSGNITIDGQLTFNNTPNADRRRQLSRRVGQGVDLNTPAYPIHNALERLSQSTVSPNATHANGAIKDLDVHNLFGTMEGEATYNALLKIYPNKRPFLISRSTSPGAGRTVGHWTGDNYSSWKYMRYVVQGLLQFQIYGIPMVGADICGFNGNTDEELCNRWSQFGAFSPFTRNHNTKSALSQEPYRWDSVAEAARTALLIKNSLLPLWYTLFHNASEAGTPPLRSLTWEFPNDESLVAVDAQYLVGSSLLITPVFEPNVSSVVGVLPGGDETVWRDFYTHKVLYNSAAHTFDAPLGHLPLAIRSDSIHLIHSSPGQTIYDTLQSPYNLLVSLSPSCTASSSAYFDDGESIKQDATRTVYFRAEKNKVYAYTEGAFKVKSRLEQITILGVDAKPTTVTLNGKKITTFAYEKDIQRLVVAKLKGDLNNGWELNWS